MERYVTVAEVRDLLEQQAEERGIDFLLNSQKSALEHAQRCSEITAETARQICDKVASLDYVTEPVAVKIADLNPRFPEDVRPIFSKERVELDNEKIEEILQIVRDSD